MERRNRKRGQSTAEYLVVLALVLAAVTAMQVFGQRAMQAKIFGAWNKFANVGASSNANTYLQTNKQYEPYYVEENVNIAQNQSATVKVGTNYSVNRTSVTQNTTRTGNMNTGVTLTGDDAWN